MRREVFNTLERAVSTDFNRLQAFGRLTLDELAKWLFDAYTSEELAASVVATGTGVEAPARATIINGLCPYIEAGTDQTIIKIAPGLIFINDFDSPINTDASLFKFVDDVGVDGTTGNAYAADGVTKLLGALAFTPNGAASTRVDVIECARLPDVTLEEDNRDIFNNVTGLFTAATVPKVLEDQLKYRIRTGVAGAGYPGSVAGWVPLAVMAVPAGATSLDDCNLWDVRPLLSDMARKPFDISEALPITTKRSTYRLSCAAAGPYTNVIGLYEGIIGNRIIGGTMILDPSSTDYKEAGAGPFVLGIPYHVYQATFHGLPRWARYSTNSAALRIPLDPRGVTIVTQTGCDAVGAPLLPLVPPAITGLTESTVAARAAYTGYIANITGDFVGTVTSPDGETTLDEQGVPARAIPLALASTVGTTITWNMVDDVHHPGNATHARVRFQVVLEPNAVETIAFTGSYSSEIGTWSFLAPTDATHNYVVGATVNYIFAPLNQLPKASKLDEIHVWVQASGVPGMPGTPPALLLVSTTPQGVTAIINSQSDTSVDVAAFQALHTIDLTGLGFTVADDKNYAAAVQVTDGLAAGSFRVFGMTFVGKGFHDLRGTWLIRSLNGAGSASCWEMLGDTVTVHTTNNTHVIEAWIPLYPNLTNTLTTRQVQLFYGLNVAFTAVSAYVVGWRQR